ncbi:MAG: Na+/H+ antiporter subunit E [Clostridia bacterium]|nr:Na+/H+ antiporter subunit E [Clostridia bacterium]
MFICFFALWVVLNGKWTTEIGVFGLVFAALAYAFTWKYMGYSPKVDIELLMRVPSAVRYGVNLVAEIVKANLAVTKMILRSDFVPEPQLVKFDADLKKKRHLVALANSITLTPGTITVDLEDNHFLVHALDASMVDGLDDGVFVQQLMQMEEKHTKPDAVKAAEPAAEEAAVSEETPAAEATAAAEEAAAEPENTQIEEGNGDEH